MSSKRKGTSKPPPSPNSSDNENETESRKKKSTSTEDDSSDASGPENESDTLTTEHYKNTYGGRFINGNNIASDEKKYAPGKKETRILRNHKKRCKRLLLLWIFGKNGNQIPGHTPENFVLEKCKPNSKEVILTPELFEKLNFGNEERIAYYYRVLNNKGYNEKLAMTKALKPPTPIQKPLTVNVTPEILCSEAKSFDKVPNLTLSGELSDPAEDDEDLLDPDLRKKDEPEEYTIDPELLAITGNIGEISLVNPKSSESKVGTPVSLTSTTLPSPKDVTLATKEVSLKANKSILTGSPKLLRSKAKAPEDSWKQMEFMRQLTELHLRIHNLESDKRSLEIENYKLKDECKSVLAYQSRLETIEAAMKSHSEKIEAAMKSHSDKNEAAITMLYKIIANSISALKSTPYTAKETKTVLESAITI